MSEIAIRGAERPPGYFERLRELFRDAFWNKGSSRGLTALTRCLTGVELYNRTQNSRLPVVRRDVDRSA